MSFDRPTRDETCMETAKLWAARGTCQRRQVGVVIAFEGRILATGYNGAPKGLPHCDHSCKCTLGDEGDPRPMTEEEAKVMGHHPACPCHPDAPVCRDAVHAEANAIAFAAKYGLALDHATLYTTYSPCLACAQLIVNAGIVRVMCSESYHDPSGMRLLIQAGLQVA